MPGHNETESVGYTPPSTTGTRTGTNDIGQTPGSQSGTNDLGGPGAPGTGGVGSQPADIGGLDPSAGSSSGGWATPYSLSTTPTSLTGGSSTTVLAGGTVPPAGPPMDQRTITGYITAPGKLLFKSSTGVIVNSNIRDGTALAGLQPNAINMLHVMAEKAADAGIASLVVTAGKGGGHLSHFTGTQIDLIGYAADGKKWTQEQRAAVAAAGSLAGADRFGLYSFGKGTGGQGILHAGFSFKGHPPSVWGFGGLKKGNASRQFTNPAEVKFRDMFYGGTLAKGVGSFVKGGPLLRGDHLGDTRTSEVPDPRPRPEPALIGVQPGLSAPAMHPSTNIEALGGVILDHGRILTKGETGTHVGELQAFLNVQGYRDNAGNALEVDDNFGRLTRQAVKNYQRASQISVDGKVGPETYQAMLYDLDPSTAIMPGQAAYDLGERTATKIIDPGREVYHASDDAIRLAQAAYRDPAYNEIGLTRQEMAVAPASASAPDGMDFSGASKPIDTVPQTMIDQRNRSRQVDAANRDWAVAHSDFPDPLADRGTALQRSTYRRLGALIGESLAEIRARQAGTAAMKQRFDDASKPQDRFRSAPDMLPDLDTTIVRGAEALREFVRGISDSYRRVIDRQRAAASAPAKPSVIDTVNPIRFDPVGSTVDGKVTRLAPWLTGGSAAGATTATYGFR